ncbi:hypothetical protein Tco_1191638 [Tanacetum coccineum]
MIVEETQAPKRTKEQIQQEEASLAEAIRLRTLEEEETAKQVNLDALLAKRMEEEELTEQQKQRKAQVQFEAQYYTKKIVCQLGAKLEANVIIKRKCKEKVSIRRLCKEDDRSTMSNRHKDWLVQEQTALGKDFSNPFMADNLPKIVWLSTHHIYVCKELASPQGYGLCQCCCLFVAEKIIHVAVKCWPCCLKDLMLQISLVMISRVADRSQEPVYTGKSSCCSSRIIPNIMLTKSSGSYNEDTERNLKFTSEDQVRGGLLGIIVNRLKSGSYRVKSGRHS